MSIIQFIKGRPHFCQIGNFFIGDMGPAEIVGKCSTPHFVELLEMVYIFKMSTFIKRFMFNVNLIKELYFIV